MKRSLQASEEEEESSLKSSLESNEKLSIALPRLPLDQAQFIAQEAIAWAFSNGLIINGMVSPFTLVPSSFQKVLVDFAVEISPLFSELVHIVSLDTAFIIDKLKSVEDDFTQKLLDILKDITKEGGPTQKLALGIHRSDYMIHHPPSPKNKGDTNGKEEDRLLQVEINTISAAFGGLGGIVCRLHRYLIERFGVLNYESNKLFPNDPAKGIAAALAQAKALYPEKDSVIVMVVNKGEVNSTDQRILEYKLWEHHEVSLIRRSLTDIGERGVLDETSKQFSIDGHKVAIFYFRSGYKPDDYPTDLEWTARLTIERSNAIKCPNINYHLVGTKKMQQILAEPGQLESFFGTSLFSSGMADLKEKCSKLRKCFAGLYSLDPDDEPEEIIRKVLESPEKYVMKPQREGGGNLLYGDAMLEALKSMKPNERAAYILMEKIVPQPVPTYVLLKSGQLVVMDAISELGTYGVFIGNDKKSFLNECVGTLVRTKSRDDADGGVCAGVAVLDCPYLI